VRRNLQAMDGEIYVVNRDGGGLTVVMRLPLAN
jgi:signal transduction histidine kinase